MAGGIERGDVRLYRFPPPPGTAAGTGPAGLHPPQSTPVLVLTRGSAIAYLTRVTVAPITSTIRGVPSEVPLGAEDGMRQSCVVNLHNVMTVAQRGLGRRLAQLRLRRMQEVCEALTFALGCDG